MKFEKLVNLVTEAKGTKPGERYFNARESDPTRQVDVGGGKFVSPVSSSPIGKSSYNPTIEPRVNKDPKDMGGNAVSTIKLLGKAFQVLNNDEAFKDQMRGIMNGFKKNRHQISSHQESVIKTKPKVIDNLWGQINRLIKIVNDPKKREDPDHGKFVAELDEVKARKDEHQAELDEVETAVENITLENEEINDQYLDQLLVVVDNTARRLYKKLSDELLIDPKQSKLSTIPINELDFDKLEKDVVKDSESQLQLLDMLISEDESINPLHIFLNLQKERYDEAKNRFFEVKRGDNYSLSIEQLYTNLPLFSLVNYFSHTILRSPVIKLSTVQSKRAKQASGGDGILKRLSDVKTETQFDLIKPELIEYINDLDQSVSFKSMLLGLANGSFIGRRGSANAAIKIMSALRASNIEESFDKLFEKLINEKVWNDDDFKLDIMEVLSYYK